MNTCYACGRDMTDKRNNKYCSEPCRVIGMRREAGLLKMKATGKNYFPDPGDNLFRVMTEQEWYDSPERKKLRETYYAYHNKPVPEA